MTAKEDEKTQVSTVDCKMGLISEDAKIEQTIVEDNLEVLDNSIRKSTSRVWQSLGIAWKGSFDSVCKFENSVVNLDESIQHSGMSSAVSFLEPSMQNLEKLALQRDCK